MPVRVPHAGGQDIVAFLKALKRHFRGRKLILIWDRLPGHKANATQVYLATQRSWLSTEWLPAYAPDLNPVELVWGRSKNTSVANQVVDHLDDVAEHLRKSLRSVTSHLGFAFFCHAGLSPTCIITLLREDRQGVPRPR